MDLKSGFPFWAVKNCLMHVFPQLEADLSCDEVVMGAGITGALIAYAPAGPGHDVAVLDRREVCWGSTLGSTALLQYEIDTHATELAKRYDQDSNLLETTLLWESARPYLDLRRIGDRGLLVGGEDDRDIPARRDRMVDRKPATLQRKVSRLLPRIHAQPALAWVGTFAETSHGLALFGYHPQYGARVLFALAYGGNGTTCSMLGAGLLCAQIERRSHPLTELFAFARLG